MSEPDRLYSSDEGYDERPKGTARVEGGAEGEAAAMSLVSQEAQRGELYGGGDGGEAWGSDGAFDATAHGALAAQAGVGAAFMAEMSRRGQCDELRAGEGADGGVGGLDARGAAGADGAVSGGAGVEQAGGGLGAASGPPVARDDAGGGLAAATSASAGRGGDGPETAAAGTRARPVLHRRVPLSRNSAGPSTASTRRKVAPTAGGGRGRGSASTLTTATSNWPCPGLAPRRSRGSEHARTSPRPACGGSR